MPSEQVIFVIFEYFSTHLSTSEYPRKISKYFEGHRLALFNLQFMSIFRLLQPESLHHSVNACGVWAQAAVATVEESAHEVLKNWGSPIPSQRDWKQSLYSTGGCLEGGQQPVGNDGGGDHWRRERNKTMVSYLTISSHFSNTSIFKLSIIIKTNTASKTC